MLLVALGCGGLAASEVRERERRAAAAVGPSVPVVVAQRDIPAARRLRPGDLVLRRVPVRFTPPDALRVAAGLDGVRLAVPVAAGSYLTAGLLEGAAREEGGLRAGERAVEVAVGGGSSLAGAAPGARVDVVVSTPGDQGAGQAFVALENVELLALRSGGGEAGGLATLRVSAREAVQLLAAADFAQRVRLLVRPPGDRTLIGPAAAGVP
jgi:Flp pilus assembly protein CpaB